MCRKRPRPLPGPTQRPLGVRRNSPSTGITESIPEFIKRKMEKLLQEGSPNLFDEKFYQELTNEFNRGGTSDIINIEVEQVRRWFTYKMIDHVREADSSPRDSMELVTASGTSNGSKELVIVPDSLLGSSKEAVVAPDTKASNNAPESTIDMPKDTGEKIAEDTGEKIVEDTGKKNADDIGEKIADDMEEEINEDDWEFEAKSSREGAWYDIATFISYRINSAGDYEVLVRFQDFGPEEDEWVDVLKSVRERSIPLESYDCHKVAVGELVLCFRETKERAAYYDARIMEIQKKQHDIRGCRCRFLVKFDMDQAELTVRMKDLCRRPVYELATGTADK